MKKSFIPIFDEVVQCDTDFDVKFGAVLHGSIAPHELIQGSLADELAITQLRTHLSSMHEAYVSPEM